jgi:hypothetical protein
LTSDSELTRQRLYNGKNRTPYVKDAFHDYVVPSHRPKEPEPEKGNSGGLPMRRSSTPGSPEVPTKSPRLPGMTNVDDEDDSAPATGIDTGSKESLVEPPPRPRSSNGGSHFVNPENKGTKAGAHYVFNGVPGKGGCVVVRLKMTPNTPDQDPSILDEELFDDVIEDRRTDADEFYDMIARGALSDDLRNIMRQALSGMMWYVFG